MKPGREEAEVSLRCRLVGEVVPVGVVAPEADSLAVAEGGRNNPGSVLCEKGFAPGLRAVPEGKVPFPLSEDIVKSDKSGGLLPLSEVRSLKRGVSGQ